MLLILFLMMVGSGLAKAIPLALAHLAGCTDKRAFVKEFFSPVLGHKNAHSHKKHCIVAAEWCALIAALKQPNGGMLPPLPGLVSAACSAHLPAPLRRASAACLFAQDHARP